MVSFKSFIEEQIKGWKHAHSDLAKHRADKASAEHNVALHKLNASGKESGMHDARKTFKSEEDAVKHHENIKKLNPTSKIKHNLYVNGKVKKVLD